MVYYNHQIIIQTRKIEKVRNHMIILSIIIPHYNTPVKLKRLLNTIPIINDLEVIIVDDKSTSDFELLEQLKEKYKVHNFSFFENNYKDNSAGTCRNIGIEKASGRWLLFADADDYFIEGFYDKIRVYLESNNDIIFFTPTSYDEITNEISDRHVGYSKLVCNYLEDSSSLQNQLYLRYGFDAPISKLINANFIERNAIKFDEVIAANDVMFSVKAGFYARKIKVSSEIIYCITKDKGTLTQDVSELVYFSRLDAHIAKMLFLREHLDSKEFKMLNINGRRYIINSFLHKLGIRVLFIALNRIRKAKMKILDFRFFNPFFILSKIIYHLKNNRISSIYRK